MAQAVGELTEQGSPAFEAALPILSQLLKAETADREVRSTAYQLKAARFPNYRDLAGFDFAWRARSTRRSSASFTAASFSRTPTMSSWSAAPSPSHNAHLTISLKNQR
jgi:IstB-like ATP binding protein